MAIRSCCTTNWRNRWVMSQFSVSTTPYLQCIAVSTTSDATGTWNRYSFQYSNFDDYPKMGVWADGYYETFNMFQGGTTFVGADACAYNRTAMLAGQSATQVCFQQSSSVGGLLPADLRWHYCSACRFAELYDLLRNQLAESIQIPRGLRYALESQPSPARPSST